MKRAVLALVLAPLALCSTSCELVVYSDNLVNDNRHSSFVTKPASVMGVLGFVVGLPFDLLALPVTYTIYSAQKARYPDTADPLSTLLFPSFVLWRTGVILIGAPLDAIEFVTWRAWTSEPRDQAPEKSGTEPPLDPVESGIPAEGGRDTPPESRESRPGRS